MKRVPSLEMVFATLVAGCGGGETSVTTTDSSVSETQCPDTEITEMFEVDAAMLDGLVTPDGRIEPDDCQQACEIAGAWGQTQSCELLGAAPPQGTGDTTSQTETGATTDDPTTSGSTETGSGGSTGATTGVEDTTTGGQTLLVECSFIEWCLGGRGHASLRSRPRADAADRVAGWLASTAHAEAASVVSFAALRHELRAHGAPHHLLERLHQAAVDEVRHARAMAHLARRRGHTPKRPHFCRIDVRDLETIAIENAVEGCVRETWAALEASHQAAHATDTDVRQVMKRIAADETRHAELARDLDAWLTTRLGPAARRRVATARREAIEQLHVGMRGERDPDLCRRAGLPDRPTARRLLDGLREQVWA